jgi:predicted Zn-dependent protease
MAGISPATSPPLAALLRYSRDAEREADTYARQTMDKANINPMGLRTFFEKMIKDEGGAAPAAKDSSALDTLGNVFSTHPGTEDRIKQITPPARRPDACTGSHAGTVEEPAVNLRMSLSQVLFLRARQTS